MLDNHSKKTQLIKAVINPNDFQLVFQNITKLTSNYKITVNNKQYFQMHEVTYLATMTIQVAMS